MTNQNFNRSITANVSASEAINKISRITGWWGVTCTGKAEKSGDKFVIKMGGDSFFNMTIEELIPNKKAVWLVTDCYMPWYQDKKEWKTTN